MQIDNVLRSTLVREAESIPADLASAMPAVARRVRDDRRRRAGRLAVTAAVMAATVWGPQVAEMPTRDVDVSPARRHPVPTERSGEVRNPSTYGATIDGRVRGRRIDRRSDKTPRPERATDESRSRSSRAGDAPPPAADTPAQVAPRELSERYEVNYVLGTHTGENGGAGCWQGDSVTGYNDCIPIEILATESEIVLTIVDDTGIQVGATVSQNVRGEATEIAAFCGSSGPIAVQPDALVFVDVDTTDRCSSERPTSGILTASIR